MSPHHWLPVIYTVHCRVLFNSSQCFTACLKVAPQKKVTAGAPERCSEGEVGSRAPGLPWGQGDSELPKLVAPEPLAGALQVGLGMGTGGWSRQEHSELQAAVLLRPAASNPASVRARGNPGDFLQRYHTWAGSPASAWGFIPTDPFPVHAQSRAWGWRCGDGSSCRTQGTAGQSHPKAARAAVESLLLPARPSCSHSSPGASAVQPNGSSR